MPHPPTKRDSAAIHSSPDGATLGALLLTLALVLCLMAAMFARQIGAITDPVRAGGCNPHHRVGADGKKRCELIELRRDLIS